MITDVLDRLSIALAGRYSLHRELGRGGMATVYLAQDLRHDRPIAIKVLHPELATTLGPERFQREIRVAAQLQHPQILPVYDSGADADVLWFTMPYVEGETLRQRLRHAGALAVPEAGRILGDIARALAYAHRRGVIHRDVKPENVLISPENVFLADFGVAKPAEAAANQYLTTAGLVVGTPTYMAGPRRPSRVAGSRSRVVSSSRPRCTSGVPAGAGPRSTCRSSLPRPGSCWLVRTRRWGMGTRRR